MKEVLINMESIVLAGRPGLTGAAPRPHVAGGDARGQRYAIGWSSLTEAELRVVRLVIAGLTNKQIASQLYLSWHTVNSHLRNVLLKLDLHSRVDLTRVALQHDPRLAG